MPKPFSQDALFKVYGRFPEYWDWPGNLAQQGLPVSDGIQEPYVTDGSAYSGQYY
ncbi:MAG TPA: hypothetical protein VF914_07190 [Chloroflexia bacterium]|jgi:hypothetical protein